MDLGCSGNGFTIYPGSSFRNDIYEQIREISQEARSIGLPTLIWSYPREVGPPRPAKTAIDVVKYGARIACQLGARIVKVRLPTDYIE